MHHLLEIIRAYKNKITNKVWGLVTVPAKGRKKGVVLLSYITGPFTHAPWEHFTDPHTHPWAAKEIARLLSERGYACDIIDSHNTTFIPHKPYRLCIDIGVNLERLTPLLPKDCVKVFFIEGSYAEFQNAAEQKRLDALEKRRGVRLKPRRQVPLTNTPAFADYLVGNGNKTVHGTYAKFNKKIIPIQGFVMAEYPFPATKDFEAARTQFLWFGGGGAVHKGLDLTLEAIAAIPELTLHIVGPAAGEHDFAAAYAKELRNPNVRLYPRPHIDAAGKVTIGGEDFMRVMNRCVAVIFPSASEGGGASALQAMHAGLIPIVTKETGMGDDAPAVFIEPSVPVIQEAARTIATTDPETLKERSRAAWEYARNHYTKTHFTAAWVRFFDETLKL